jgi:hypothetical protein
VDEIEDIFGLSSKFVPETPRQIYPLEQRRTINAQRSARSRPLWTALPAMRKRATAPQSPREQCESSMKKKHAAPAPRPQEAMHRFDRLLAAMAPRAAPPPKPQPKKKPARKRGTANGGL